MKNATFRIIRFTTSRGERYVGLAWNYAEAVLISTKDEASADEAWRVLEIECVKREVNMRWFDGVYFCNGKDDQIFKESDGVALVRGMRQ